MRSWSESEQIVRALLLSVYAVDMFEKPDQFKLWFYFKRDPLDGRSCADLVENKEWRVLANYLDDALTGQPS